jgi:hypothetical protein
MLLQESTSVRFQNIEIIEFAFTIGDSPSVTCGVPLTMEWVAQKRTTLSLEFFESYRPARQEDKNKLRLSRGNRKQLLLESGYSEEDIDHAAMEAETGRKQRLQSIHQLKKMGVLNSTKIASSKLIDSMKLVTNDETSNRCSMPTTNVTPKFAPARTA